MPESMTTYLFIFIGYLCGSLPFSVWLGKGFLGVDIRQAGEDRNPGSANVFKAAGKSKWWLGLTVLLLDGLKGLIPTAIARYQFGITDWQLVPVALAPIAGHAFSIFLNFKGGKALATTVGIWTALTVYIFEPIQGGFLSPAVLGGFFGLFSVLLTSSAWAVMFGMLGLLGYLLLTRAAGWLIAVWAGNLLILLVKHWKELNRLPSWKRPQQSTGS